MSLYRFAIQDPWNRGVLAYADVSGLTPQEQHAPVEATKGNYVVVRGDAIAPVVVRLFPSPEVPAENFFGLLVNGRQVTPELRRLPGGQEVLIIPLAIKPGAYKVVNVDCYVRGFDPNTPMGTDDKAKKLPTFEVPPTEQVEAALAGGDFIARPIEGQPGEKTFQVSINTAGW